MSAGRFIDKYFLPEIAAIIKSYMPMEFMVLEWAQPRHCIVYDNMVISFDWDNILKIFDVYTGNVVKTFGKQPFDHVSSILCNGHKIFVAASDSEVDVDKNTYIIYVYDISTGKRYILYKNKWKSLGMTTTTKSIRKDFYIDIYECPFIVGNYIVIKGFIDNVYAERMKKVLLLPIDKKTNRKNEISSIRPYVDSFRVSNNKKFYCSLSDESIQQCTIYDNLTDKELYKNEKDEIIRSIDPKYEGLIDKYYAIDSISEDSSFLVITANSSACYETRTHINEIYVFDTKSNKIIYTANPREFFNTIEHPIVSTSGKLIYISTDEIKIVNIHSKKEIGSYTLKMPKNNDIKMSLSNDENILVISYGGDIILCHIGCL